MRWSEKGRVTGRRVKGGSFDPLQPQAIFWLTLELRAEIFLGTPGAWDVEVKWIGELERNEIQATEEENCLIRALPGLALTISLSCFRPSYSVPSLNSFFSSKKLRVRAPSSKAACFFQPQFRNSFLGRLGLAKNWSVLVCLVRFLFLLLSLLARQPRMRSGTELKKEDQQKKAGTKRA